METGLMRWRYRWEGAGIPTIPLFPNSKEPASGRRWQLIPSGEQWERVGGSSFRGNIGTIMGNGIAVIDCDSIPCAAMVTSGLVGLGVDANQLPQVSTATPDHCQFYLRVSGAPEMIDGQGRSWGNLSTDVGPGEFRWGGGAMCVAPCSEVDGIRYHFVRGYPELLPRLPIIRWQDLGAWLLTGPVVAPVALDCLPIPLVKRAMPRRAALLLDRLASTEVAKGQPVIFLDLGTMETRIYQTRSECEQAVTTMLVLAGWTFAEIRAEFERMLPGHYRDRKNASERARCIRREYEHALGNLAANPTRAQIADLYQQAQSWPWPGRGGGLERAVFLALLSLCWQFARWEVCASVRDLAEVAAASIQGVCNALARLRENGLITRGQGWHTDIEAGELVTIAHQWQVGTGCCISGHKSQEEGLVEGTACVGDAAGSAAATAVEGVGEVWTRLGRAAGAVYAHLDAEPLSVNGLAECTGKHRSTIWRALSRLQAYGLAERTAGGWVRGGGDLGDVAREVDAEGRAQRRRAAHDLQREAWYDRIRSKAR